MFLHKKRLKKDGIYVSNLATLSSILGNFFNRFKKWFGFNKKCTFNWVRPSGKDLEKIAALVTEGKLIPIVATVFPLEQAVHAHMYFQKTSIIGKVVLKA